ncbi:MAG: ABC transporter permease subunit [Fervidobacterium sp.]
MVYIIISLVIPFALSLKLSQGLSWSAITDNISKIRFTIFQAFLSAIFTALLGLPGAYLVGRTKLNSLVRKIFRVISSIPFVLPGITMAIGFFLTFGKSGIYSKILGAFGINVQILYTFTAIVLGHVFYNFPLFIRIVGEAWENIDGFVIEAAKLDGAGKWKTFLKVELPLLIPSILRAFFLTYIYTFTSFSVVLILGGIKYSTIEVTIYMYSRITFDFKSASTLMLFQLLFISFIGYFVSVKREVHEKNFHTHLEKFPKWGYVLFGFYIILIFVPLFYSAISGFLDYYGRFSLTNFRIFFSENLEYLVGTTVKEMIFYTILISTVSSIISILISTIGGYYSSRGKRFNYILFLPAAMSSVTIAFPYVLINIPILAKIVVTHSLIVLPITFGIIETGWRSIPNNIIEAAKVDGAGDILTFSKIALPLLKNFIFTAFVYSVTISVGETSGTLTLVEPPIMTFSTVVFRLMNSRNTEVAMVLNTFYFIFVVSLFIMVEFSRKEEVL